MEAKEIGAEQRLKTGTTTVAIKCTDGIVLGADSRATAGNMIVGKDVVKIEQISDYMAVTIAGSVSDIQLLVKLIRAEVKLKQIRSIKQVSVKEAANLLGGLVYSTIRNYFPGIAHFLLGGWDSSGYHIYDVYPDGSVSKVEDYICSGSGSVFEFGILETEYRQDITISQGKALAMKTVNAALQRDSGSGNSIRIVTITEKGVQTDSVKKVSYELK